MIKARLLSITHLAITFLKHKCILNTQLNATFKNGVLFIEKFPQSSL